MKNIITLPPYVDIIIRRLKKSGFEAYAVGGCVRDSLLGKMPKDYDITTNAFPEDIKRIFLDYRTVDTGIRFGTVTVISEGMPIEITTYRTDGIYSDHRRPENVEFSSSLAEDLKRRDFTINAMAFSRETGIIDLFGGENDLKNRIIRAIGEPAERFNEDALRIMRGLRFAACGNFTIEPKTAEAIHEYAPLLRNIAGERIAAELNRLICTDCESILREFYDVFAVFIPEINRCHGFEQHTKYHNRDVYEHIIATVSAIEPILPLRLAMLFHDIAKPDYFSMSNDGAGHFKGHSKGSAAIAERVLRELKYDSKTVSEVIALVENHDIVIENRENLLKRYLNRFGEQQLFHLIDVHIADDMGKAPQFMQRIETYRAARQTVVHLLEQRKCFSLKQLAVNGNDMKRLGLCGEEIGAMLKALLSEVIDEKCENEKNKLLEAADEIRRNQNERG